MFTIVFVILHYIHTAHGCSRSNVDAGTGLIAGRRSLGMVAVPSQEISRPYRDLVPGAMNEANVRPSPPSGQRIAMTSPRIGRERRPIDTHK